jgi:hypothetical protein
LRPRQRERECASAAFATFRPNTAALSLHQGFADSQPETKAGRYSIGSLLAVKWRENRLGVLQADTAVSDRNLDAALAFGNAKVDCGAPGAVLEGVPNQILQDLLEVPLDSEDRLISL